MKLTKSGLPIPVHNRKDTIDQWSIPGFWHVPFVNPGISEGSKCIKRAYWMSSGNFCARERYCLPVVG